jgi:hypothetical protein
MQLATGSPIFPFVLFDQDGNPFGFHIDAGNHSVSDGAHEIALLLRRSALRYFHANDRHFSLLIDNPGHDEPRANVRQTSDLRVSVQAQLSGKITEPRKLNLRQQATDHWHERG